MSQFLINTVVLSEKRLAVENERRKYHQYEPFKDSSVEIESVHNKNQPLHSQTIEIQKKCQPVVGCYIQECCHDTQPG